MIRKFLLFSVLLFVVGFAFASTLRGNGIMRTQVRHLADFNVVNVSGAFSVELQVGQQPLVSVQADTNLLSHITTTVSGNVLTVKTDRNSLNFTHPPVIIIHLRRLSDLQLSGANQVVVKNLHEDHFQLTASGANQLQLSGTVDNLSIHLSGASKLDALNLVAQHASLNLTGASKAVVDAQETLDVDMSGAGSVRYTGHPVLDQRMSGMGELAALD